MEKYPLKKIIVPCKKCLKVNRVDLDKAISAVPICANCKAYLPFSENVQEVNGQTLKKLLANSDMPVVVDFWASWCGPCKMFAPVFKSTAKNMSDRLIFAKLNTEEDSHAANLYKIQAIPTLILFKHGIEVDRQSGAMTPSSFASYLLKFLNE